VEVLHYWTSGGEAKSAAELKKMMQAKGHTWRDFAVAGPAGFDPSQYTSGTDFDASAETVFNRLTQFKRGGTA
jgi:hypothetical protein